MNNQKVICKLKDLIEYNKFSKEQKKTILSLWQDNFENINSKSIKQAEEYCKKYISLRKKLK